MEVYNIEIKYRYENSLGIFKENPIKTTNVSVPGKDKEDAFRKRLKRKPRISPGLFL